MVSKEVNRWKIFYFLILIIGVFFAILEILIFRKTLINVFVPVLIVFITGFIAFLFDRRRYKKTYSLKNNFFPIFQSIVSYGFIFCYLFMAVNYYLASPVIEDYKAIIKEKSSMPGSKHHRNESEPLVRFEYFGFKKELIFEFNEIDKVKAADSVRVKIKKGRLGFNIIESYDVFD